MGTQIEANDMRAILNAIEAAHQAVKLTGVIHAESVCLTYLTLNGNLKK
jgi:uncharacterized protein YqgV (UPF0045/DUF77 family)